MRYDHITEKPYCCVPAVLQMIQVRRGLQSMSQDEIGWELDSIICTALDHDDDIVLCLNSLHLFGDGDIEHVFLIEEYNGAIGQVTVVDPAIGGPMQRVTTVDRIFKTIKNHNVSVLGGLWIISASTGHTTRAYSGSQKAGAR